MSGALSLIDFRAAIIAGLAARLPGVREVKDYGGDVTLDMLKRYMQDAPCLRVALTGVGEMHRHGSGLWVLPVQVSVIVVTKDVAAAGQGIIEKDSAALALASSVVLAAQANRWGLDDVRQPEHMQAHNEFSGDIDKLGVAVWRVMWAQEILMGEEASDAIAALSAVWINGAPIAAPADPVTSPLGDPLGYIRPIDITAPGSAP